MRLLVGFLNGATGGSVTYEVTYYPPCQDDVGCGVQITRFTSTYNGVLLSRLLDLSARAPSSGTFDIRVEGGSLTTGDSAVWITAQVERP